MEFPTLRDSYPGAAKLHAAPDIHVVDDFVRGSECHQLIRLAEPSLSDSRVSGDKSGVVSQGRMNAVSWIRHHHNEVTTQLAARIADLIGLPLENAEAFQVICYDAGHEYRPHFDAYDLSTERGQRCCERGGQRLVTVLGYLSAVEAGGATAFPKLDIAVDPIPGRLLVFHNCYSGENLRHPDTLHQGQPVVRGRKWAFNLWFHERQFQKAAAV